MSERIVIRFLSFNVLQKPDLIKFKQQFAV